MYMKIEQLKPNPLNEKIYGVENIDTPLLDDIKEKGILSPIVITQDNLIVSGHTRFKIAQKLGMTEVPVEVKHFNSTEDAGLALIAYNKTRIKNYIQEMQEIDEEKKLRVAAGESVGFQQMAESRNMSKGTYHRKNFLWTATKKGDDFAENQVRLVQEGKTTVDKAYKKLCEHNNEIKVREARKEQAKLGETLEKSQRLYPGKFQEVLDFIPDNTVDAIITDPPYPKEFLDCWADLGEFAFRKLRPGGWLVAYSGQMFLPQVIERLQKSGLAYNWTMALYHNGTRQDVWGLDLNVMWKPVLVYVKPYDNDGNQKPKLESKGHDDYLISVQEEKAGHNWQQSESSVVNLVETFTNKGDFVVDPFAGSGTTLAVAEQLGRVVIGAEVNIETYNIACARLAAVE